MTLKKAGLLCVYVLSLWRCQTAKNADGSSGGSGSEEENSQSKPVPKSFNILDVVAQKDGNLITWEASEGATSYRVEWVVAGKAKTTLLACDDEIAERVYMHEEVASGVSYTYRVVAVNGFGKTSSASDVTVVRAVKPGSFALLDVSSERMRVVVSWQNSPNAQSYKIWRRNVETQQVEAVQCASGQSVSPCTDNTLTPDTLYDYGVVAVQKYEETESSNTLRGQGWKRPLPFVMLDAVAGYRKVTVRWSVSEHADSYTLLRWSGPGDPQIVPCVSGSPCTDTGVENNVAYQYQTVADNADGSRAASNMLSATPHGWESIQQYGAPNGALSNVQLAVVGNNNVFVAGNVSPMSSFQGFSRCDFMNGNYCVDYILNFYSIFHTQYDASGHRDWLKQEASAVAMGMQVFVPLSTFVSSVLPASNNGYILAGRKAGFFFSRNSPSYEDPYISSRDPEMMRYDDFRWHGYLAAFDPNDGMPSMRWEYLFRPLDVRSEMVDVSRNNEGTFFALGVGDYGINHDNLNPTTSGFFLAKISSEGVKAWIRSDLFAPFERLSSVAASGDQGVFVAGSTIDYIDGDYENPVCGFTVKKWDANAQLVWGKSEQLDTGCTGYFSVSVTDSAVDAEGNVYVVGVTEGSFRNIGMNGANRTTFVVSYNHEGTERWLRPIAASEGDTEGKAILVQAGRVAVVGKTSGVFSGNIRHGYTDAFLVELSADTGAFVAATQFGNGATEATSVVMDQDQTMLVGGTTTGSLTEDPVIGFADGFVAPVRRAPWVWVNTTFSIPI